MTGLTYSMWSYDLRPPRHPRLVGILEQIRQTEANLDNLRQEYVKAEAELSRSNRDPEAGRTAAKIYEREQTARAEEKQRADARAAQRIEELKAQQEEAARHAEWMEKSFGRTLK